MEAAIVARRPTRRRLAMTALVATAALMVAGCSSSDDPASNEDADGASVPHFTMGLGAAPASFDVTRYFDTNAMGIMSLFTEPLEYVSGDGTLTPNLAQEVTQPDDLTIVYTIRDGVRFSNGKPLTPEDVVWTIEHVTDAEAGAQTSSATLSFQSAEVTGDHEVTVTLSRPDPSARAALALVALVQDSEFAEANAAELGQPTAIPIGTGPYVITSSTAEAVELERNENYWGENPGPDTITISFFDSDDTAQLAMRSESLDGTVVANPVTLPQYESIAGTTVYTNPVLLSYFWALDTASAPFDDLHVRKAVAHAIDREGLLQAAFGTGASLLPALLPRGMLTPVASEADVDAFLDSLEPIEYDLDKARDELAQSRYADGFDLEIPVIAGSWMELTALNLQQNLAPMGTTITTRSVTTQEYVEMLYNGDTTAMFPMSLAAGVPDPGPLATVTEDARAQPGGFNVANWAPEDLRPVVASLLQDPDDAARFEAATTILARISEEVPYIPMYQPDSIIVLADGFSFTEAPMMIDIASGIWVRLLRAG